MLIPVTVDDGTGVVSVHVKKNEALNENLSTLGSQLQNDSSFMVFVFLKTTL